jgi:hypothetical protein
VPLDSTPFKPAIPRRFLLLLAGFFWAMAGGILCFRAYIWIAEKSVESMMLIETASLVVATGAYLLWFSKLVMRNVARIHRLPEWACAFAFTAWHGYLMIGVMMTLGILLRNSSVPKLFLAVPYGIMGIVLLAGGIRFVREFVTAHRAG